MTMKHISAMVVVISAVAAAQASPVPPVGVSYSVTGSAGNYTLDFSLANQTGDSTLGLYYFGVRIDSFLSAPTAWNSFGTSNISVYGGPSGPYQTSWVSSPFTGPYITDGNSLGGFKVLYTGSSVPASIDWFAFGADPDGYSGPGNFSNYPEYPGFAGSVTQAVPEPASMAALGLGGLALLRRRRAKK
ncbi:PEP-CTERM sorting domain-containing protein [bacterium]|nr:MAG: PEP-CTERM sorting domain-containing protein [bacterium]